MYEDVCRSNTVSLSSSGVVLDHTRSLALCRGAVKLVDKLQALVGTDGRHGGSFPPPVG